MRRLNVPFLAALVVPLSIVFFSIGGCSSDSDNNSGGPGTNDRPVSKAECEPKCESKAATCGATDAQAKQVCPSLCESATASQLECLQAKPCSELANIDSLDAACPKATPPPGGNTGKKQFGDSCVCPDAPENAQGYCSGTDAPCSADLACVYTGGKGAGQCMAENCCSKSTSECEKDPSLLTQCTRGQCKQVGYVGFYCSK
ncbi:hypothetical protein LZC95_49560 [Pendulispora brunnea]|uniref:IGFBP N-terminal domain-containing protein n=1 Tax=Pendulispora brunnea TaxID=2905690 RepID=A0ABZ2K719_9BACT